MQRYQEKRRKKCFALCNRDKAPYNNVVLECRPNPHVVCLKKSKKMSDQSRLWHVLVLTTGSFDFI
jgi:hypothetical protein